MLRCGAGVFVAAALVAALLLPACGGDGGEAQEPQAQTPETSTTTVATTTVATTTAPATTTEATLTGVRPKAGTFVLRKQGKRPGVAIFVGKRGKVANVILVCDFPNFPDFQDFAFQPIDMGSDWSFVAYLTDPTVVEGIFVSPTRAKGVIRDPCESGKTYRYVAKRTKPQRY